MRSLTDAFNRYKLSQRKVALVVSFFFFLYPISIDGVSVNYSFLLMPLWYLLFDRTFRIRQELLFYAGLFTLIFIIASLYQHEFYEDGLRRMISYILFVSMFSYAFVRIDDEMVEAFKIAIVGIGLYFSLFSVCTYIVLGGSDLGYTAKDIVGGQRFGFIYIFGIWLLYQHPHRSIRSIKIILCGMMMILIIGLLLTFSRSSVIGLVGSFTVFALIQLLSWLKKPVLKVIVRNVIAITLIGVITVIVYTIVPITFQYFNERLLSYLFDANAVADDLSNINSSGGTRVYIVTRILDYVLRNPFTGSGFLGVWIFNDDLFGSAHNQYMDVLFRTGMIGFMTYIYLLSHLMKYLFRRHAGLFWGLFGVLLYGMFHETFKESQGGFVLAFLLGMMFQSLMKSKHESVPDHSIAV